MLRHPQIELPPTHSTHVPHQVSMRILLGRILWLEGQPDQARALWQQEKAAFPESAAYIDQLLGRLDAQGKVAPQ